MRKTVLSLMILLLAGIDSAFAQRVDVDKKSGLITVDGQPSFYLMGKNRALFQADYSLENLQHQELAYLKAIQQPVYSPVTNTNTTETFYAMTFSKTGNSCELHGFTSFSIFKSLAKTIAAARIVQNNDISVQEERKFVVMNRGEFFQDQNGGGPRGGDDRGQYGDNRDPRGGMNGGTRGDRDNQYDDRGANGRGNVNDGRGGRDDRGNIRNNDDANDDRNGNQDGRNNNADNGQVAGPAVPINISITNGRIYDGDELIGTYKQTAGKKKGEVIITIMDADAHKIGTASRTASATDWSILLADGKKLAVRYRAESPLVKLFTFLAEKGNL